MGPALIFVQLYQPMPRRTVKLPAERWCIAWKILIKGAILIKKYFRLTPWILVKTHDFSAWQYLFLTIQAIEKTIYGALTHKLKILLDNFRVHLLH